MLNAAKSKFMILFNFLGYTLDQNISWKPHITKMAIKIARVIGVLHKLKHIFPQHILLTIYNSLIQPHLIYGCSCLMLNGRCTGKDDFTSVSPKVVDYAIVNQDYLYLCSDFIVHRAHDIFTLTGLVGTCDPDHAIPDH